MTTKSDQRRTCAKAIDVDPLTDETEDPCVEEPSLDWLSGDPLAAARMCVLLARLNTNDLSLCQREAREINENTRSLLRTAALYLDKAVRERQRPAPLQIRQTTQAWPLHLGGLVVQRRLVELRRQAQALERVLGSNYTLDSSFCGALASDLADLDAALIGESAS